MRKKLCICDVCRQSYWKNASSGYRTRFYHVKVTSSWIWNYDLDEYVTGEKKLDICKNCVEDFQTWMKERRKND